MAGETHKTTALVLDIRPWSRTSHIVTWLTPERGPIATLVKGAVRPKSAFLGQYDLFYTCELVYYVRAKGELHAIREASPIAAREHLRGRFRATALASYASYHQAPRSMGFSRQEHKKDPFRDLTRISCFDRWVLYYEPPGKSWDRE